MFYLQQQEKELEKVDTIPLISDMQKCLDMESLKLNQLGSEIQEAKLKQVASEMIFPSLFAYVPWMHHVLIIQRCKTIKEAFYIGLVGFEDSIKEIGDVREVYQEVQDRSEYEGQSYRQDLRDILNKLVEFNHSSKSTSEPY